MSVSTLYLRFPDLFGLFLHRYKVLHCITILTILDVEIKDNPLKPQAMELVIQVTKLNPKAVIPYFYNLYLSADTLDELTAKIRKHIDPIFPQVVRLRLLCRRDGHYTTLPPEWRVTVENLIY